MKLSESSSSSTPQNTQPTLFSTFSSQSIVNLQNLSNNNQSTITPDKNEKLNLLNNDLSLLEWIKSTDSKNTLNNVIEETKEMLKNFDSKFQMKDVQDKINKIFSQVENNSQMREIEGLTKRLQDLNNFLDISKNILASQQDIEAVPKSMFKLFQLIFNCFNFLRAFEQI